MFALIVLPERLEQSGAGIWLDSVASQIECVRACVKASCVCVCVCVHGPGVGSLTAGRLAGGDAQNLGGQTHRARVYQALRLGSLENTKNTTTQKTTKMDEQRVWWPPSFAAQLPRVAASPACCVLCVLALMRSSQTFSSSLTLREVRVMRILWMGASVPSKPVAAFLIGAPDILQWRERRGEND